MRIFLLPLFAILGVSLSSCPSEPKADVSTTTVAVNDSDSGKIEPVPVIQDSIPVVEEISTDQVEPEKKPVRNEEEKNGEDEQEDPRRYDRPRPLHPKVIKAEKIPLDTRSTSMNIVNAEISGSVITITFSYGGGCKPHLFELFSPLNNPEKGVVQVYLTDITTDDMCKKLITETQKFDISPLKDPSQKSLLIKINSHKPPVEWTYGR